SLDKHHKNNLRTSATHELAAGTANGYVMFVVGLALLGAAVSLFVTGGITAPKNGWIIALIILGALTLIILGLLTLRGLYILQPNQAALLLLFGKYRGTDRNAGLRWTNPFYSRTKMSLRVHN